jgi:hypothetical protein
MYDNEEIVNSEITLCETTISAHAEARRKNRSRRPLWSNLPISKSIGRLMCLPYTHTT